MLSKIVVRTSHSGGMRKTGTCRRNTPSRSSCLLRFLLIVPVIFVFILNVSCFGGGGGKDSGDPDPGSSYTLTFNVTYTDAGTYTSGDTIYVELYKNPADIGNVEAGSFQGKRTISSVNGTVSFDLAGGTYYALLYLDKDSGGSLSEDDFYVIYNNQTIEGTPTAINLSESKSIDISFNNANSYTEPASGPLSFNLAYTGAHYAAGDDIVVEVYDNPADLGDIGADSWWGLGRISAATGTWSIDLPPGTYYAITYLTKNENEFFDYGDYYEIYDNKNLAGAPTAIHHSGSTAITISLDDTNCYTDPYKYLTVNYAYTGTHYTSGASIDLDVYTSSMTLVDSDYAQAASGSFLMRVDPGTYYIVVYLDLDNNWEIGTGDYYELYDGVSKTGTPTAIDLSTSSQEVTVSFGDAYQW
ncbi:MAG: hypothetical protein EPN93_09240 [Spirochaetes bacterium]|nr:MAG: hypothetical protein EPN93_09240 [Spirochaetota bacterium]